MVSADRFPGRTVTVWQGDEGFTLSAGGERLKAHPVKAPDTVKGDFSGFVLDGDLLHLRAVKRFAVGGEQRTLISDLPIAHGMLQAATAHLGSATLILPDRSGDPAHRAPAKRPARHARL